MTPRHGSGPSPRPSTLSPAGSRTPSPACSPPKPPQQTERRRTLHPTSSRHQARAIGGNSFFLVPKSVTSELPWMPAVPETLLIRQQRCHTTSLGHCPSKPWVALPQVTAARTLSGDLWLLAQPGLCDLGGWRRIPTPSGVSQSPGSASLTISVPSQEPLLSQKLLPREQVTVKLWQQVVLGLVSGLPLPSSPETSHNLSEL